MYIPQSQRYADGRMRYRRCGDSGLRLSEISLGLWKNFGRTVPLSEVEGMIHTAFDCGITCFDLANNYGAPHNGSAEENMGRVMASSMKPHRHEMVISTKAGFDMWEGPYGRGGSRKYLLSSLDESLKRLGLEYVDIFYHHVYDPETPLEETAMALDSAVRQGKALYAGISNYSLEQTRRMTEILREMKTPFIANQISYSMLNRWIEKDGLDVWAAENGVGLTVYSPLYQGLLTDKYLAGVPKDSRIGKGDTWLGPDIDSGLKAKLRRLSSLAEKRKEPLSQLALSWILRNSAVASVIIGASSKEQIVENCGCLKAADFSEEELLSIEKILEE